MGNTLVKTGDTNCIDTTFEGKAIRACLMKDGAFYDSIETILEDTAMTEYGEKAATKACRTGLVWKQRNPYIITKGTTEGANSLRTSKEGKNMAFRIKDIKAKDLLHPSTTIEGTNNIVSNIGFKIAF